MTITTHRCINHPERNAIGVCIITRQAVCAECSTRYEGINYSRSGLAILKAERAQAAKRTTTRERLCVILGTAFSPVLLYLLYRFYLTSAQTLIDIAQLEFFS